MDCLGLLACVGDSEANLPQQAPLSALCRTLALLDAARGASYCLLAGHVPVKTVRSWSLRQKTAHSSAMHGMPRDRACLLLAAWALATVEAIATLSAYIWPRYDAECSMTASSVDRIET